jgi:CRP-like cAMP-binding protein
MTNILNKINSLFPISDDTVQVLKENVTCCRFPKKYQLIKADTYCKSAFFIEKGITRSFWLVDGEEVTTSFAREGSIVFSMDELYYGKISEEYVETLEEVEAYQISRATLTHLFQTSPNPSPSDDYHGSDIGSDRFPHTRQCPMGFGIRKCG